MALNPTYTPDEGDWICARCGGPLEQKTLAVRYLGSSFDVSLPVWSALRADPGSSLPGLGKDGGS